MEGKREGRKKERKKVRDEYKKKNYSLRDLNMYM